MTFHPDIHHRRSIRLRDYDYSSAGAYFFTICAIERECLWGEIADGKMMLNPFGEIVRDEWIAIGDLRPSVELFDFVVMPNHFHGIIAIAPACDLVPNPGVMNRAPTFGEIVRGFKARCTRAINLLRNNAGAPIWQRNYYDRVIRNENEMAQAREYIINNPMKWELDQENL